MFLSLVVTFFSIQTRCASTHYVFLRSRIPLVMIVPLLIKKLPTFEINFSLRVTLVISLKERFYRDLMSPLYVEVFQVIVIKLAITVKPKKA